MITISKTKLKKLRKLLRPIGIIVFIIGVSIPLFLEAPSKADAMENLYLSKWDIVSGEIPTSKINNNTLRASISPCFISEVVVQEKTLMDKIILCESGGNPEAKNPNSSAYGICQMIDSTWDYCMKKWGMSLDRNNPEDQRYACDRLLEEEGTRHWLETKECWSK